MADPGETDTTNRPAAAPKMVTRKTSPRSDDVAPANGSDEESDELNLSPKAIVGILVAAVVLVVALIFLSSGGESDDGSDQASDNPPVSTGGQSGSVPPKSTPSATGKPVPAGPKEPTGGPSGSPTDDFNQPDGPVGPPWMAIGGWVREGGVLSLKDPAEGLNQIAVRDMGSANGTVSAVVVGIPNRSGLAFRYKDQENYWLLSPAKNYATWTLHKVVDGDISPVATAGFSATGKNTTVNVITDGQDIRVQVDGIERLAVTSDTHQEATMAGFVVTADNLDSVKWDSFYAIPA